jgi:hypothetical protein
MLDFAETLARYTYSGRGNYDPKCFELAEHFLPNGTEDQKDALAQAIQTAIEDHLWEPEQ